MGDSGSQSSVAGEDGPKRGLLSGLVPSSSVMQALGVAFLVAAVLGLVALLAWSALGSRSSYLEKRNLRELDHIAASVTATGEALGSVPALYLIPSQLDFKLAPGTDCLIATNEVRRGASASIRIEYRFVDTSLPAGAQPDRQADPPGRVAPAAAPAARCNYQPTPPAASGETLRVGDREIRLVRRLTLSEVLSNMRAASGGTIASARCSGVGGSPDAAPLPGTAEGIRECFARAAAEDLAAHGSTGAAVGREAVRRSLEAAFRADAISAHITADLDTLDIEQPLQAFDAVQILGPVERKANGSTVAPLHFQFGEIPPAIQGGDADRQKQLLSAVLSDQGTQAGKGPGRSWTSDIEATGDNLLMESSVHRTGGLVIFQKKYPNLGGLDCSRAAPCRLIGIVGEQKFHVTARRVDGAQATTFLIVVMTLIGLIPLIQLALRKRLDPIGRVNQYVMWFSLTLLAASAIIASLAAWSSLVSRRAGKVAAESAIEDARCRFDAELRATLLRIGALGNTLNPSPQYFPAPASITLSETEAGKKAIADPNAAIIETVALFRRDGTPQRDWESGTYLQRVSYGTRIADRKYFRRALSGEYHDYRGAPGCDHARSSSGQPNPRPAGDKFVIDRVLARPDGTAKTVILTPPPARVRALENSSSGPAGTAVLLASGYLKSFKDVPLRPGLELAVIDPTRSVGEPDVLFHSRGAELVERFTRDLDSSGRFDAIIEDLAIEGGVETRRLRTNYRGGPVRLTVGKFHPSLDWLIVAIEHRNDAGYAQWRAASFGYGTWLAAMLLLFLISLLARIRSPHSLDRRPGLWMWPRASLTDFTPHRFPEEEARKALLEKAAKRRDWHITLVILSGMPAIFAAEGASRTLLALGMAAAAFAGRAYFRGQTTDDPPAARRLDRVFILLAGLLASLSTGLFLHSIIEHGAAEHGFVIIRLILFFGSLLLLPFALVAAWRWSKPADLPAAQMGARVPKMRLGPGWMLVILAAGGIPAGAGYLDSIDQDFHLIEERQERLDLAAKQETERFYRLIAKNRTATQPEPARTEPAGHEHDQDAQPTSRATAAGTVMRYLDLHGRALEFSDQPAFHMSNGFGRPLDRTITGLVLAALPIGILLLLLTYFRRHYFRRSPQTPFGKDFYFEPPLTCSRTAFLDVLTRASEGKLLNRGDDDIPPLPFGDDPGKRHLILGVDLDLVDEPALDPVRHRIAWVDLLSVAEQPESDEATSIELEPGSPFAVVIGNLDIVLQLPDPAQIRRVFQALESLVGRRAREQAPERHFFLLASIEPLDRIALLRERTSDEWRLSMIEDWRWAALLQDFTLCAVTSTPDTLQFSAWLVGRVRKRFPSFDKTARDYVAYLLAKHFDEIRANSQPCAPASRASLMLTPRDRAAARLIVQEIAAARGQNTGAPPPSLGRRLAQAWTAFSEKHPSVSPGADATNRGPSGSVRAPQGRWSAARAALGPASLQEGRTEEELVGKIATIVATRYPDPRADTAARRKLPRNVPMAEQELAVVNTHFARALLCGLPPSLLRPCLPADQEERLVAYVAEQLADNYHKIWASSGDEERVILYHLAWGWHLKMEDSRALRSVLSRGLVVRSPEYQLMNRSFARYVRTVERSEIIRLRASRVNGIDQIWPVIRYPLAAFAASLLILLQLIGPSQGTGGVGPVAALGAIVPALVANWLRMRGPAHE